VARVDTFEHDNAGVLSQTPHNLIVTHVNRPNARGSVLKQAVCETSGRGSNIETVLTARIDFEFAQRRLKLQTATPRIAKSLAFDSNLSLRIDQLTGFVDTLFSNKHLSGEDQGMSACAALDQPAFHQDSVYSLLCHFVCRRGLRTSSSAIARPTSFSSGRCPLLKTYT